MAILAVTLNSPDPQRWAKSICTLSETRPVRSLAVTLDVAMDLIGRIIRSVLEELR